MGDFSSNPPAFPAAGGPSSPPLGPARPERLRRTPSWHARERRAGGTGRAPKKQAKKLAKARKALEKLLTGAEKADEKQRLSAPLATIRAAVAAALTQL